jgi:hypothetical protein
MDVLIQMSAKPHPTRLGGTVTLKNTKPRESAPFAPIGLETTLHRLPDGQTSLLVHGTARPHPVRTEAASHDITRADVRQALQVLGHAKPAQVAEYLNCDPKDSKGRKRTQWHLNQMVLEGEAVREHGVYRLAAREAA